MMWQECYQEWQSKADLDQEVKSQMDKMPSVDLEDAFTGQLDFGTAGMRGLLGPGPNRMNLYTVRQASEGLAQLILSKGKEAQESGVAIAYDSRHLSQEFALEAAKILGNHQIKVYLYESLRPTPVLSFAVRQLQAAAGIMITASHNPADYNGYKVYGPDGGQMVPEDAAALTDFIRQIPNMLDLEVADPEKLKEEELLTMVGSDLDRLYLDQVADVSVDHDLIKDMADQVKIVFTPLHGTGYAMGMEALSQAGFTQVFPVKEQAQGNVAFPTVTSPNPEDPSAFALAESLGQTKQADILLASDPDADRLGAMIRCGDGSYRHLSGNQLAVLMVDYLLQAKASRNQLPTNGVVVKSIVSTDLVDALTASYGVKTVAVLTGFKFIAEKIKDYQSKQDHHFLFGFEESYGYLIKPFVRDKDAIQALLLLAEVTAYHKKQGHSLVQALEAIYQKHGYYQEKTLSKQFQGQLGKKKMTQVMADLRHKNFESMAGQTVVTSYDYLKQEARGADGLVAHLDLPQSNVLKYQLADGSWLAFRPSGTEPKIKLYYGIRADSRQALKDKEAVFDQVMADLIPDA